MREMKGAITMSLSKSMLAGVLTVVAGLAVACSNAPAEPTSHPHETNTSKPTAHTPKDSPNKLAKLSLSDDLEKTDMKAPFTMKLESVLESNGLTTINIHMNVPNAIQYPVKMTVALPKTMKVVDGVTEADLDLKTAGRFTKTLVIKTDKPLSLENPIKVLIAGQSPNGAVGFRAEKQLPAKPELIVPRYSGPTAPPQGRPPHHLTHRVAPVKH
jgi:hypothetical protein